MTPTPSHAAASSLLPPGFVEVMAPIFAASFLSDLRLLLAGGPKPASVPGCDPASVPGNQPRIRPDLPKDPPLS